MSLLQMSVAGAVMILDITVIRALAINRVPKNTFLALWGIALVRLLIPFSFPSWFSIYSLLERETPAIVKDAPAIRLFPIIPSEQLVAVPHNTSVSVADVSVWEIVWAAGVILCTMFFVLVYRKCHKEFQMSLPVENAFTQRWLQVHQIKRSISIRQSGLISVPLTFGVWHPVILMPKKTDWENESALQYVLEHEFVHIRRFDTIKKLLLIIAVCVHWFNPLVWAMYILANRDIELSCDEAVVHQFGNNTRATYAKILISMEETRSGFTPLCNNFSKNSVEERITAIMKIKKTTILSLVVAVALVTGTVTVFATSAQAGTNDDDMSQKNQSTNESSNGTATSDGVLTSYIGDDGQTHYLIDNGNTTKTLNEEEFEQQYPISNIEWWTYEEYKDWLENEKVQLQGMVGEKAWTSGRGDFVWTQEMVDEAVAKYEQVLQDIRDGMMYSKTIYGETNIMVGYDPSVTGTAYGYQLFVKLDNGDEKTFGPYKTANELLAVVKPFCEEQVKLGNMQQSEADEIISRYTENESYEEAETDELIKVALVAGTVSATSAQAGANDDDMSQKNQSAHQAQTVSDAENAANDSSTAELPGGSVDYSIYEPYGLSYDQENYYFTYNGNVVRFFNDPIAGASFTNFFSGTVDIEADRDEENNLVGIKECSKENYDRHTQKHNNFNPTDTSLSTVQKGESTPQLWLKDYADYGITYNEQSGGWYYNNQRIKILLDSEQAVVYTDEENGVCVTISRDGNHQISEIKEISETDAQSLMLKNNPIGEDYTSQE